MTLTGEALADGVGLGPLRAHPPEQGPHGRAVAADQFAELAPPARRRQGGELHVVMVHQGLGHDCFPRSGRAQSLFLLKKLSSR